MVPAAQRQSFTRATPTALWTHLQRGVLQTLTSPVTHMRMRFPQNHLRHTLAPRGKRKRTLHFNVVMRVHSNPTLLTFTHILLTTLNHTLHRTPESPSPPVHTNPWGLSRNPHATASNPSRSQAANRANSTGRQDELQAENNRATQKGRALPNETDALAKAAPLASGLNDNVSPVQSRAPCAVLIRTPPPQNSRPLHGPAAPSTRQRRPQSSTPRHTLTHNVAKPRHTHLPRAPYHLRLAPKTRFAARPRLTWVAAVPQPHITTHQHLA